MQRCRGPAEYIQEGIHFIFQKVAEGDLDVVAQHGEGFILIAGVKSVILRLRRICIRSLAALILPSAG
jgi:hypothetical protein